MSADTPTWMDDAADAVDADDDREQDLRDVVDTLANRVDDLVDDVVQARRERDDLREENERLRGRVDELTERVDDVEQHQDETADVRWDSGDPSDMVVDGDHEFPIGVAVTSKAGQSEFDELEKDVDGLLNDVHDLKVDGVDAADLVGVDGDDPQLPIEDKIAALRSDVRDDPSANKQRAAMLFRAFGGKSQKTKGGKLQLDSATARQVLEEKMGVEDVNRNTLKRAMKQTAKLTSPAPKRERRARDAENLITLTKSGDGRLMLRADADEWREYLDGVSERYQ